MIHLMTLRSKISKMKKRLSDDQYQHAPWVIATFGLFAILVAGVRVSTLKLSRGGVPGELPVLALPPDDPAFHRFQEQPNAAIRRTTPAIVFTKEAFYFGTMNSFSEQFADQRSKYIIRHIDGEPQLQTLIVTMEKWLDDREKAQNVRTDGVVVLVPNGEIPAPIVVQVMAGLRTSQKMNRIVLASGIL